MFGRAVAALKAGDGQSARRLIAGLIDGRPRDPELRYGLALATLSCGEPQRALDEVEAAIALRGDRAKDHALRGQILFSLGQAEEAEKSLRQSVALTPPTPQIAAALGFVLRHLGSHDEALSWLERSARAAPTQPDVLRVLGDEWLERGNIAGAAWCFEEATRAVPASAKEFAGLGRVRVLQGRTADAEAAWKRALQIDPACADVHAFRSVFDLARGRIDSAATAARQALAAEPGHALAHFQLAHAIRGGDGKPQLAAIDKALRHGNRPHDDRVRLHFAAGALLDTLDRVDDAFTHYAKGNHLVRSALEIDVDDYRRRIDSLTQVFGDAYFATATNGDRRGKELIFIVGMPRSGTTLLERVLASHPVVVAGGERSDMGMIANSLETRLGASAPFPDSARKLDPAGSRRIADDHLRVVSGLLDSGQGQHRQLTDKTPANFLRLGLIAALFPGARIIHCLRDPMDTCLSCFFQLFGRGNILYSYDLQTLGTYYREYRRIMTHWHRVLPVPILDVEYEAFVADPTTETRRMLEFCGLPWDDACLRFHERDTVVATASAAQVRRPVSQTSVGRWRRYQAHLDALSAALPPNAKDSHVDSVWDAG